jgi:transposase
MNCREIAKAFEYHPSTIAQWMRNIGVNRVSVAQLAFEHGLLEVKSSGGVKKLVRNLTNVSG